MTFTVLWRPSENRDNPKATIVFRYPSQLRDAASPVQSLLVLEKVASMKLLQPWQRWHRLPGSAKACSTPKGYQWPRACNTPEIMRVCSLYLSLTGSPLCVKHQPADPHLLQSNQLDRTTNPPPLARPNGSRLGAVNRPNARREIQRRQHQAARQNFVDQGDAHDESRYTYLGFRIAWL